MECLRVQLKQLNLLAFLADLIFHEPNLLTTYLIGKIAYVSIKLLIDTKSYQV